MNKKHFLTDIFQESCKICATLDSCEDQTQLELTKNWADSVINRWDYFASNNMTNREIKKTLPSIKACVEEMSNSYSVKKAYFEERLENNHVTIKGFRTYE